MSVFTVSDIMLVLVSERKGNIQIEWSSNLYLCWAMTAFMFPPIIVSLGQGKDRLLPWQPLISTLSSRQDRLLHWQPLISTLSSKQDRLLGWQPLISTVRSRQGQTTPFHVGFCEVLQGFYSKPKKVPNGATIYSKAKIMFGNCTSAGWGLTISMKTKMFVMATEEFWFGLL